MNTIDKIMALADAFRRAQWGDGPEYETLRAAIAELTEECDALRVDYGNACRLVAQMHLAATGYVTGPAVGVVEDVTTLKARHDALLEALQTIKERCGKPEFVYMTARSAIDAVRKA